MTAEATLRWVAERYGDYSVLVEAKRTGLRYEGRVRRGDGRIERVDLPPESPARRALPPLDRARILLLKDGETWRADAPQARPDVEVELALLGQLYGPALEALGAEWRAPTELELPGAIS